MFLFRTLALTCLLAAAGASAGNNDWSATGPPGGSIWSIQYQGADSTTVVATSTRSIFRSQNEGQSWTRVLEFAEPTIFQAITFNPSNRDRLLLVGPLVYRSIDGGATWNFPSGPPAQILGPAGAAYSFDGTVAWLTDQNGNVFRSLDDGQTWQQRSTGLPAIGTRVFEIVVDAANRDIAFARTGNRRIYKTLDGGGQWTELPGDVSDYAEIAASPRVPGALIATRGGIGAVRSTDYGVTWSAPSGAVFEHAEFASDLQPSALGIDGLGRVHRSTNGGLTWTVVGQMPVASVLAISIHPGNADRALVATDGGVFFTTDAGATWTERNAGLDEASFGHPLMAQDGSGALFVQSLDAEAMYRRDPVSGTWQGVARQAATAIGSVLGMFQSKAIGVHAADSRTLYYSRSGRLARSTDAGTTWQLLANLELSAITFDAANPLIGYAATSNDGLRKTTNGGVTWTPINNGLPPNGAPPTTYLQILVDPADSQVLYVTGDSPVGVHRSTDAGASWSAANAGLQNLFVSRLAFEPGNSTVLYAATGGGLFKSLNSGNSWTSIYQSPNGPLSSNILSVVVDPQVPSVVYATSLQDLRPLRSVDAGQTWERLLPIPGESVQRAKYLTLVPTQPGVVIATKDNAGMHEMRIAPILAFTSTSRELFVGSRQAVDLSFRNAGPYSAVRVSLTAVLPTASDQYSVVSNKPGCTQTGFRLDCAFDVMRPNEVANVSVEFTPANLTETLPASTTAHGAIPGFFENSLEMRTQRRIALRTSLTSDVASAVVGSDIVYSLTIFNDGPSPALAVVGSVTLAENVTFVSATAPGATCARTGRLVTCDAASVAPGAPLQVTLRVTAAASGAANTFATVFGEGFELDPGNNGSAREVTIQAAPAPTPPPSGSSSSGGGGGGGSITSSELPILLAMVIAVCCSRRRTVRELVPAAGIEPATP